MRAKIKQMGWLVRWAWTGILAVSMPCVPTAKASSFEAMVIQKGAHAGKKLVDVLEAYRVDGIAIPPRAIHDSLKFLDQYGDAKRTMEIFPIVPDQDGKSSHWADSKIFKGQPAIANQKYLVIFDTNQPQSTKSLHLINLETGEVKSTEAARGFDSVLRKGSTAWQDPFCAHAKPGVACHFVSNSGADQDEPPRATPLGFFATGGLYVNAQNKEKIMRPKIQLFGLEKPTLGGFEGNDKPTSVVIHPARYVKPGSAGNSDGCPALSYSTFSEWKDQLTGGVLFYFYNTQLDSLKRENDLSGLEPPISNAAVADRSGKAMQESTPAAPSIDPGHVSEAVPLH